MSLKIIPYSLPASDRQKIEVRAFTNFLDVHLDHRFNHTPCLLWTLQDDEKPLEKVEIIILQNEGELKPVTAKYVGSFKGNNGANFVFVSRNGDHPLVTVE